jgi:hypothetical protein
MRTKAMAKTLFKGVLLVIGRERMSNTGLNVCERLLHSDVEETKRLDALAAEG